MILEHSGHQKSVACFVPGRARLPKNETVHFCAPLGHRTRTLLSSTDRTVKTSVWHTGVALRPYETELRTTRIVTYTLWITTRTKRSVRSDHCLRRAIVIRCVLDSVLVLEGSYMPSSTIGDSGLCKPKQ